MGITDELLQHQQAQQKRGLTDELLRQIPQGVTQQQAQQARHTMGETAVDIGAGGVRGINEAIANVLGMPVDITNLAASYGWPAVQHIAERATGERLPDLSQTPVGGSQWIQQQMERTGTLGQEPVTKAGDYARSVGRVTGESVAGGAGMRAAQLGRRFLTSGPRVTEDVAVGVGGGLGGEATARTFGEAWRPVGELGAAIPAGTATHLVREAGETAPAITDYERLGIRPTLPGQMTDNPFVHYMQKTLASSPGGRGVIRRGELELMSDIDTAAERIASRIGHGTDEYSASKAIRDSLEAKRNKIVQEAKTKLNRLNGLLGKTFLPSSNTVHVARQLGNVNMTNTTSPTILGLPAMMRQSKGRLNWDSMLALYNRSTTELFSPETHLNKTTTNALQRLREALIKDMRAAIKNTPEASKRKSLHGQLTRAIEQHNEGLEDLGGALLELRQKNVSPENVFQMIVSYDRRRSTALLGSRINLLKKNVSDEAWSVLSSAVLRRMGRALPQSQNVTGTEWDPRQFLKNWHALDNQTKDAMFGNSSIRQDLDSLVRVVTNLRDRSDSIKGDDLFAIMNIMGLNIGPMALGTYVFGPLTGVLAGGGPSLAQWAIAKLYTHPTGVKAIVNMLEAIGTDASAGRRFLIFHEILEQLAEGTPTLEPAVDALQTEIERAMGNTNKPMTVDDVENITDVETLEDLANNYDQLPRDVQAAAEKRWVELSQ